LESAKVSETASVLGLVLVRASAKVLAWESELVLETERELAKVLVWVSAKGLVKEWGSALEQWSVAAMA
jgi:hypothetical protein